MQRIPDYTNHKRDIVENILFCTEKQTQYMLLYLEKRMNCQEIALACGREKSTVSRTLQRGWARLRPMLRSGKEVSATFTFNERGDIIGMKAKPTMMMGERGRIQRDRLEQLEQLFDKK